MLDQPMWVTVSIGTVLVFIGLLIPLLTIMEVIQGSIIILLLSHGASVLGLFIGIIAAAQYVAENKRDSTQE